MGAQVDKPIKSIAPQRYSSEEYLAIEVAAADRHEYRDGEIIPMAGGLPDHNQVAGNIYATLNFVLRGQPYQAFMTDQRLWVPSKQIYTYPDVMVLPLPLMLQDGRKDTVINPILVVEVLSDSTADYDRGDKFAAYRSIPSFREYVLVNQYSQQIEHYVKGKGKKWDFQVYDETDMGLELLTIGVEMTITDIYDKVKFATELPE